MRPYIQQELDAHLLIFDKFNQVENINAVEAVADLCISQLKLGNKLITCGNGGSMSDAMHMASELSGKYRGIRPAISAISLSDQSAISCIANDFGYTQIFKRQIEAIGRQGDILLCFTTSGNSENIVIAAEHAKRVGIKVVGITGNSGGKLKDYCDLLIDVPASGYPDRVQEISIIVIHILVGLIEKGL